MIRTATGHNLDRLFFPSFNLDPVNVCEEVVVNLRRLITLETQVPQRVRFGSGVDAFSCIESTHGHGPAEAALQPITSLPERPLRRPWHSPVDGRKPLGEDRRAEEGRFEIFF